jgi:hypothetical protein
MKVIPSAGISTWPVAVWPASAWSLVPSAKVMSWRMAPVFAKLTV